MPRHPESNSIKVSKRVCTFIGFGSYPSHMKVDPTSEAERSTAIDS
jgi:hypothetical protein